MAQPRIHLDLQRPYRPGLAVGMARKAPPRRVHLPHRRRSLREFAGFIFCHNEAILYHWVEEYEPALFNASSGSLVGAGGISWAAGTSSRTATCPAASPSSARACSGSEYFKEKFGVVPTTAINLRPLRPYPRARPDPRQERLRLLPLLPPRPGHTARCPATISSGSASTAPRSWPPRAEAYNSRGGGQPEAKVEALDGEHVGPGISLVLLGASATTAAAPRARTWTTSRN